MTKRRGVTEKDKATKAAKTTKTIRTYVANSSHVDIGEGNNRQDDDIERIILERREKERRERDRKEKDKEQEENENDESESEEEIPVQFGAMTNQLQICNCGYTESSDLTDEEVNNFISREVVLKRILSRYVSAIDFTKLSETSLDKLIEFSRKCFKIVWVETESANIKEKVKELDVITEDLEIPSCSGRNIASSLKLHLFS
ncbi:hypothetical protein GLOIN_2v1488591 [Rhizophagus clarus]|uniref:Uncharacterized protein n=1 Tax=Rhizophagus clarus TaxID=94130 RepID=A0A8H3MJ22_9GLOM|nr:hypothetical protein GLOIN_2v1488591 [Rhizophagus clarus]